MRVTYFQRSPHVGGYSAERAFQITRLALPEDVESHVFTVPCPRARPWELAYNTLCASTAQGDVNHISGDVHYLALGLDPNKTVLTVLDCGPVAYAKGLERWARMKLWYEIPVKRSRAVTAISSCTAEELCHLVPSARGKTHVVHIPVPLGYHHVPKEFDHRNPVLLQVGTRRSNKNLERVAQAIEGIPCILDIVGPLDDEQRRRLAELGITYRNYTRLSADEMLARYIAADVVTFVSTYEGFGMPVIEAQAIGRPVITSTVSSMPEVAGEEACLVNPMDVGAIRTAVLRVLHDEPYRRQLVEQGLENVRRFAPQVIARQYYEIYRDIC